MTTLYFKIKTWWWYLRIWVDAKRGLTRRGDGSKTRLPEVGEELLSCCPGEVWLTVKEIHIFKDAIVYEGGLGDSLRSCGWMTYEDYVASVGEDKVINPPI